MTSTIKRAAFTIAAAATIFTGAGAVGVTNAQAAPCHPHPDACEQRDTRTGTDHRPHPACSVAVLDFWCAATTPRNAR